MKVLFVASNPTSKPSLALERGKMTELQRRFLMAEGDPVQLTFFPNLAIEQLPLELTSNRFDVLHISAHEESEELALANAAGDAVTLTAEMLRELLDIERPPRVVYLHASNSQDIAKELIAVVPCAIGTTATVTNRTARAAAVLSTRAASRDAQSV